MKSLVLALVLDLLTWPAGAQVPLGDYPGVGMFLVASGPSPMKPNGSFRLLSPSEITCQLSTNAPPAGAPLGSTYMTWYDPLHPGQFCQIDATKDVQQLPQGMWYASFTFNYPATTYEPCPEYATNGSSCWLKTLDGRRFPTYDIPGHVTPAFAVGVFPRPPSNVTIKADHH